MYHMKMDIYVIQLAHQKKKRENTIITSMEHCLFAMLKQSKKTYGNRNFLHPRVRQYL